MKIILRVVDTFTDSVGKVACWLASILVALVSLEVIMRYFFDAPTMWNFETSMMVGGTLYAMGWSYAMRHHSNVRIDILYNRLSPKVRVAIDVVGAVLFFFPLMILFVPTSAAWALRAWEIGEKSVETYWYPSIAPFRTVVFLGFCLLMLQGGAQFIRDLYRLMRNKTI